MWSDLAAIWRPIFLHRKEAPKLVSLRRVSTLTVDEPPTFVLTKPDNGQENRDMLDGAPGAGSRSFGSCAGSTRLHPLAIEDASKAHQQPKVEQYGARSLSSLGPHRWSKAMSRSNAARCFQDN
jgi:hypothetical protein